MNIWMLNDKIKADCLTPTKAHLEIDLSQTPMSVTNNQALALFCNMVNQKHPPQMNVTNNETRCNISEVTSGRGRSGQGGYGCRGRGGRHGGRGGRGTKTRVDSRMVTLTDGTQIEYHASFNFPRHVYPKVKQEDRETLKKESAPYNERDGRSASTRSSKIQELRSQIQELQLVTGTQSPPTDTVSVLNQSHVSQNTETPIPWWAEGTSRLITDEQQLPLLNAMCELWLHWLSSHGPIHQETTAENELDTNADMCCLDKNFIVLRSTYRTADVYTYDSSIQPIENVPIVTAAMAYDAVATGDTFIIVLNKSLCYGDKLDHSLINPVAYGIPLWDNPYD